MPKSNSFPFRSPEGREKLWYTQKNLMARLLSGQYRELSIPYQGKKTVVFEWANPGTPPLVLLHGSMTSTVSWMGAMETLVKDFHVFSVDLPGDPGLTTVPRISLKSGQTSVWLNTALEALACGPAHFLAMSLGSWYALRFALDFPDKVQSLSLITSGGISPQRISFLPLAILLSLLGKRGREILDRKIYQKAQVPKEFLEYQEMVNREFTPMMEALPIFTEQELTGLQPPLLYIGGMKDILLDTGSTAGRLKTLLPASTRVLLPEAGHIIIDQYSTVCHWIRLQEQV